MVTFTSDAMIVVYIVWMHQQVETYGPMQLVTAFNPLPQWSTGMFMLALGMETYTVLMQPLADKIWNYTTGALVDSSPAVVDGKVYVGSADHNVYCLDAEQAIKYGALQREIQYSPLLQLLMAMSTSARMTTMSTVLMLLPAKKSGTIKNKV